MTQMTVTEARDNFSDVINRVVYSGERVCLARSGKEVACVVSVHEARILEAIENRIDLEDALQAIQEVKAEGTVSWEDLKKELEL